MLVLLLVEMFHSEGLKTGFNHRLDLRTPLTNGMTLDFELLGTLRYFLFGTPEGGVTYSSSHLGQNLIWAQLFC